MGTLSREHDHSGGAYHDHNVYPDMPQIERMSVWRLEFNRGVGCCQASPVRRITAYYDADGEFLFEHDPMPEAES